MTSTTSTPMFPSAYLPKEWRGEPIAPLGYRGTQFTFADIAPLIEPGEGFHLMIMGQRVRVSDMHLAASPRDPNHPLFFQVYGRHYNYSVSIWDDRVVINVRYLTNHQASHMFPVTRGQLEQALQTIISDHQRLRHPS